MREAAVPGTSYNEDVTMLIVLMYLFHEYVAKNCIPYYKLKFEAREAANRFVYVTRNQLDGREVQ